tara:strand:+ start:523 stop:777 length:255 start_codon:yes stop_codon:yes gene_type:complete
MKKLLLTLLCLPIIGFGQDVKNFTHCDIMINQLLEHTVSFIKHKNAPKTKFRFYLTTQESSINWNKERLSKWEISDKKPEKLKQ